MIIHYTIPKIRCVTHVIVIFHFGLFFALFAPNSQKNQNFKKMKKIPGDITILHMCTKIMIRRCTVPKIWCATKGQTES